MMLSRSTELGEIPRLHVALERVDDDVFRRLGRHIGGNGQSEGEQEHEAQGSGTTHGVPLLLSRPTSLTPTADAVARNPVKHVHRQLASRLLRPKASDVSLLVRLRPLHVRARLSR
jgi:hypothetical protein